VPGPVVFGRPGLRRFFAIAAYPFEVCCNYTLRRLKAIGSAPLLPSWWICASNNPQRSFHGEDALKALTVLDQPALPVELNATLELAAAFEGASIAPATQAGPAGASLGIGV
jgi:hypothetical protein